MNWLPFLFGFKGRLNRAKLWIWLAGAILAFVVLALLGRIVAEVTGLRAITYLSDILMVGVFWSYLAAVARRLHDRGKSALWLLVFVLLPFLLHAANAILGWHGVRAGAADLPPAAMILSLANFGIMIWAFVELYCLRGTAGPNRYGPDPLQIDQEHLADSEGARA